MVYDTVSGSMKKEIAETFGTYLPTKNRKFYKPEVHKINPHLRETLDPTNELPVSMYFGEQIT